MENFFLSQTGTSPKSTFRTSVVGILNLSPDSFYEKSRVKNLDQAIQMAERFQEEGAGFLDIGAESSRPGSIPVSEELEIERLLPVVKALHKRVDLPISVDTSKPRVAERVLDAGAGVINDITGLQGHTGMAEVIARYGAGAVIMHMRGTPQNMQEAPIYMDLIGEIKSYLKKGLQVAENAGIDPDRVAVDPGIGFGKTVEHNLEILARLDEFGDLDRPLFLGLSRKSFIGKVLDLPEVEERVEGSLAATVVGVMKGARIIRTHDVKATVRAVKIAEAIMKFERNSE